MRADGVLPADLPDPDFAVERPKSRGHGDFSTNAAMLLAKSARANPRALAETLRAALPADADIANVEIAGPGFLNIHLAAAAWHREVATVLAQAATYGRNTSGGGVRVGVVVVELACDVPAIGLE